MSAFEAFCANCGASTHIDLLDAKPARLAGPGHDPALRLRELSDALFDNEDCDRLECQVCYGPGWLPARSIPETYRTVMKSPTTRTVRSALWISGLSHPRRQTRPSRQTPDHLPHLPISHRKIELHLKIEPELRIDAEPVAEPQRRIASDRSLTTDDLADTVRRHVDLPGKLGGCNAEFTQLILQDAPGVDGTLEHPLVPFHEW